MSHAGGGSEWTERKTQAKGPRSVTAKQIHWTSETTDHGGQPTANVEEPQGFGCGQSSDRGS